MMGLDTLNRQLIQFSLQMEQFSSMKESMYMYIVPQTNSLQVLWMNMQN